ncbi:MAG: response regulator transcription factor [Gemmatimonadaceae bacterium]
MPRILLVEDNRAIAQGLRLALEQEGYDVRLSGDGADALQRIRSWLPELVILDLMLPTLDGLHVLRQLRADGLAMPVLILSARDTEVEKVRGFRIGADDYVTKPFSLDELLARVDAHFRRERRLSAREGVPVVALDAELSTPLGMLTVSAGTRTVCRNGEPVVLRPKEFDLLLALARRQGGIVSRVELLQEVWGYDTDVVTRTVDTHIVELRRKLERDPAAPEVSITVRKSGYRLTGALADREVVLGT